MNTDEHSDPTPPGRAPLIRGLEPFDTFYRSERRSIVGLAYVLSHSRLAAEDLAQDAFTAAYRRWEEVGRLDDPGAWVRRVVANRSVSRFRRRLAELRTLPRLVAGQRPGRLPELDAEAAELWAEVGRLSARQRQVIADPSDQPQVGLGRSTDGGATWAFIPSEETPSSTGPNLAAVGNVLVAPVKDETGSVWVLTSQDSGATWFAPEVPVPDSYLPGGMMGAVVAADEADRFVVHGGNGKWVSSDGVNWEASIQDTSSRSLLWFPQIVNDILVVPGVDNRIYVAAAGQALEAVLEPAAEGVRLASSSGTVLAWGTSTSDSNATGTWLGTTTDGRTWSEHVSDLTFTVVHPLSDDLGSGYVAVAPGPAPSAATVYRSPDLDTWTEITTIETGAETPISIPWMVEVDGGILAFVSGDEQSLWLLDLGE